jgi:hypothetical protein
MRGGKREGAGRKPKIDARPIMMAELAERLTTFSRREHRVVVALASFGATDDVIATALGLNISELSEFYRSELDTGRALASANLVAALWRKAATGHVGAIRELERRMSSQMGESDDER